MKLKLAHTLFAVAIGSAMLLSLSSCSHSGNGGQAATKQAPTGKSAMAPSTVKSSTMDPDPKGAAAARTASMHAPGVASKPTHGTASTNWFGGPIYHGKPALALTAALVQAGGGAKNFKFSTAVKSMLGKKIGLPIVEKLLKQVGQQNADRFVPGMTFAVNDALKRAAQAGITLPPPAKLKGAALAKALVKAGTTPSGTFWAGYMFDRLISHKLHDQVLADIDAKSGHAADGNVHRVLNDLMFDVAQALGMKNVKLAPFH